MRRIPAILLLLAVTGVSHQTLAQETGGPETNDGQREVSIPVGRVAVVGWFVPPADDKSFRFKLKDSGFIVEMYWSDFSENERKHIRSQFGLTSNDSGGLAFGQMIKALRVTLKDKTTYLGVEHPENYDGSPELLLVIRGVKRLPVPRSKIESVETIDIMESLVFDAPEVYRREMKRRGEPETAEAHLELARLCLSWRLPEQGLDHLERAEILNDALRNENLRAELINLLSVDSENALAQKIETFYRAKNYYSAIKYIDQFMRIFPNSPRIEAIAAIRADAEEKKGKSDADAVILAMYASIETVLLKKLNTPVYSGESVKGLQIVTKSGGRYIGMIKEETPTTVVIETQKGDELRIARNIIASMGEAEIGEGEKTSITYNELTRWIDSDDMSKDMIAFVAEKTGLSVDEVSEVWDDRTRSVIEITKTGVKHIKLRTVSERTTNWGNGSWLRPGTEIVSPKVSTSQALTTTGLSAAQRAEMREAIQKIAKDNKLPDIETWWTAASGSDKIRILMSMAAESFFDVVSVKSHVCQNCGGKGVVLMKSGQIEYEKRCPVCLGARYNFEIKYR